MDGLCNFYADRESPYSRNLFPFRSVSTELAVSGVTFNESQQAHEIHHTDIPHAQLDAWLARDQNSRAYNQGRPSIFRIVWINRNKDTNGWSYEIRKADLEKILECFQIERAFQYIYTAEAGIADFPDVHGNSNIHTHCVFISNFFGVAWAYNSDSGTTEAVCWGDPWIIFQMQRLLNHQMALCGHATALEVFAITVLQERIDRDLLSKINEIRSVEIRTGYHDWAILETAPAEGNYAALSAKMSGCAAFLAGVRRLTRVIDEFLRCHTSFLEHQHTYTNNSTDSKVQLVNASMRECKKTLKRRLAMQEVQLDFLLQRTQIQLTAVSDPMLLNQ